MSYTSQFYGLAVRDIVSGTINLKADTFGAMLTAGYPFNQDVHHYRSTITGEITGSGYTAGGATITGVTISYGTAANEVRWDFDNPTWTAGSFSASQLIVFKSRGGTSSADELVLYVEFGSTQTVSGTTFTYQVPATGAGVFTVS